MIARHDAAVTGLLTKLGMSRVGRNAGVRQQCYARVADTGEADTIDLRGTGIAEASESAVLEYTVG